MGSTVFIAWRRGSNKKSGLTRRSLVTAAGTGSEAVFAEHVVFSGTTFRDAGNGALDEKLVSLSLREVTPKKANGREVAKSRANITATPPPTSVTLARGISLVVSVTTKPLKLNNKRFR